MITRADLIDVPERRSVAGETFEIRSAENNTLKLTGYASVFDRGYDVHGGPDLGGWTEVVTRSAFKRTLSENPHVHLLINHEGLPLASTKSGTLRLSVDSQGLLTEASLDRRNSRVNDLAISMERGDVDEMSFAFRVKAQSWSNDETTRSLDEVSLHKGDVSVVSFGANPFTSVALRSAVKMLGRSDLGPRELAELRSMGDQVERAMEALRCARSDDKPYGDVTYADPKNGKYPIDTEEHVRAAWSYINMPKNQKDYSPAELSEIKDRIRAAGKKFGIKFEGESNSLRSVAPNIITGDKSEFAQQVHDMAANAGADCTSARSLSPLVEDAGGLEGGDTFDHSGNVDSTLAQAIHDLCSEGGADCDPLRIPDDVPMFEPVPESNSDSMTLSDAVATTTKPGNLTLAEAARLCRPADSRDPYRICDVDAGC